MMREKYQIYVDEERGVVVAKLSGGEFQKAVYSAAMGKLGNKFKMSKINTRMFGTNPLNELIYFYFTKWVRERNIGNSVVTRAKCNFNRGEDFSEEIGTYIAVDRMDRKIADMAFKFLWDLEKEIEDIDFEILKELRKICKFIGKTEKHIQNLGYPEE